MRTDQMPPCRTSEPAWIFQKARINPGVMYARYKVAAVSIKPKKWDKAHNADKMEAFFREAAKEKPHLIVATETMLEGHMILDAVWHRERVVALLDVAEPLDGPYMRRFRKLARNLKSCVCFGFLERTGKAVANSAVFIDHRGNIRGTYRKVSDGTGAHPSWTFFRPGRRLRAFDTPLGRCGIVICSDRWIPLASRTLVLDGAQFLLIPTDGSSDRGQNLTVLARARENGVPVVQANDMGHNLIISKGEIVAYEQGIDRITTAFIDIPKRPSPEAARAAEKEFLKFQRQMEKIHYRNTIAMVKRAEPSPDVANGFTSEKKFQKLKQSNWGENGSRYP